MSNKYVALNDESKNVNLTTFNKVDHKIEALRLAVSMHEPVKGSKDEAEADHAIASILKMSDKFLEHLRQRS